MPCHYRFPRAADLVVIVVVLVLILSSRVHAANDAAPQTLTNSIGMKLALIPAGEFQMGSPVGEQGRTDDEHQHRVRITRPFYMGIYPVTQAEYKLVMGSTPSYFSSVAGGKDKIGKQDTSRFPVERVSWNNAQDFCRHLRQKEGKIYRLPTEAEWEYACRAGTKTVFHFGDSLSSAQANFNGTCPYGSAEKGAYLGRTCVVGSYPRAEKHDCASPGGLAILCLRILP